MFLAILDVVWGFLNASWEEPVWTTLLWVGWLLLDM